MVERADIWIIASCLVAAFLLRPFLGKHEDHGRFTHRDPRFYLTILYLIAICTAAHFLSGHTWRFAIWMIGLMAILELQWSLYRRVFTGRRARSSGQTSPSGQAKIILTDLR